MRLTDTLLLDYKRCSRRAFLNVYGNPQERDIDRDFLLKLRQESQNHIASVLATFYPAYHQPQAPERDWEARARETEDLMKQGVDCIYRGVLLQAAPPTSEPFTLMGSPHLLVKHPGQSKFGDWYYVSLSIQLGRRPKPEYKIVAAFYAQLLGILQDTLPPTPLLILRQQNYYAVDLSQWLPRLQVTLAECREMLVQGQKPEVFISRQRCALCHWYNHCYAIAQSQQHLSLVPGVTPSRYEFLKAMGVATVESLAQASPVSMGEVMGTEVATSLQQQAQSIVQNRAFRRSYSHVSTRTIPTAPIELYFDIEAEPERNLDYLLGVLLVDRAGNQQQFFPFLAQTPEDEGKIWQEFVALMTRYPTAPIFHFSEYERETIKRLAQLYSTPRSLVESLLIRCVDLHQWVTASAILPVESYSLKSLANWLGFYWREHGAGGDQCVCWYDQWMKTGDRTLLDSILRYNEDDCRATLHLKNWLVEFLA